MKLVKLLLAIAMGFVIFTGQSEAEKTKAKVNSEDYIIGKSDSLEIYVWKEPEITRTITVRNDGKISLPLIDDIKAAGRTPMELKKVIHAELGDFIESPEVTVIVQAQASQSYYMIGEIAGTGEYPLLKDMTLVQALAKAGGFTEWADRDDILLLRRVDGQDKRIRLDYDAIVSGDDPDHNMMLQPGDTIILR
jgi:polysaccharide export outer membrane protein